MRLLPNREKSRQAKKQKGDVHFERGAGDITEARQEKEIESNLCSRFMPIILRIHTPR